MSNKSLKFVLSYTVVWLSIFFDVFAQDVQIQINDSFNTSTDTFIYQKPFSLRQEIINHALQFIGKNYKRGGTGSAGFDCSGFTMMIFKDFGIKLPHTSAGQSLVGNEIKLKQVQPGDLVFFLGRNRKSKRIGHVGIVVSNQGEPVAFVHSSVGHGVRIDKVEYPYYKVRFVKAVRVLK